MIAAYASLALSMMMVGANVVILKILAGDLPIFVILGLRSVLAALVLAPFARVRWIPGRRVLGNLVLQAGFGTLAYNVLLLAGLQRTGAVQAGLVLATLPAVIALGAAILLREGLSWRQWLAVGLAGLGIAALARGGGGFSLIGDGLVFGAVGGEAVYALLARRAAGQLPVAQASFWMQVASAVFCMPLAIVQIPAAHFTLGIGLLLVVHSLTSSLLALLLWYHGMKRVKAGVAGAFTALLPATATLAGVVILGEAFTQGDAVGLVALLCSIVLIVSPQVRLRPWSKKASA
ncbi:DMT family transporter [Acidiphilium sp. PA]|uniref:DMT family transporter n=1 Tax=Acidiphilium sp. PA TaxID=2871705 RepID=UPI002243FCD7|nr:DMT family transporter [Acidiphilium sp. PA]MCW8307917.1 DMT family transporter [Acidiphilium sp. PA]